MDLSDALALGVHLHRQRQFVEAEGLYKAVLDTVPDHPDALHFLGVLNHELGRSTEGIEMIERAIAVVPDHVDMHNNLGNVLSECGRLEAAEAAYRNAIALQPDLVDCHNNLGIVLKEQGRLDEALATYNHALELAPDKAETLHNLANVFRKSGRHDEAVATYLKAIELMPFHRETYRKLARLYYLGGQIAEAVALYRRWLNHAPDDPVPRHMLAASGDGAAPERASDDFVRQTFDGFSASFDKVLERLQYRAPALVADAIANALGAPDGRRDVLDAGCGTGLCGPLLAPYARRLVGIDLSAAMIAKASGRDVYDELITAELTDFLRGCEASWDLIASADTLCYFGVLGPVATAAAGALRMSGLFAFTLEKFEGGGAAAPDGYHLHPHGRYSHTEGYVRDILAEAGLAPASITEAVLRNESGRPVVGLVVAARKRAAG
jgi:predicted TPR repeat methyltransferase